MQLSFDRSTGPCNCPIEKGRGQTSLPPETFLAARHALMQAQACIRTTLSGAIRPCAHTSSKKRLSAFLVESLAGPSSPSPWRERGRCRRTADAKPSICGRTGLKDVSAPHMPHAALLECGRFSLSFAFLDSVSLLAGSGRVGSWMKVEHRLHLLCRSFYFLLLV